jgi:hypothetical protein
VSLRSKLIASAIFIPGFVLVIFAAFGPGQGAGTPSGDRLDKIGFALMFIGIAITLILRFRRKVV